jgi:hypothetical protein
MRSTRSIEPSMPDDVVQRDDDGGAGRPPFGAEICHPRDDPRFDVAFNEFPGGWPGWRRAFKRVAAEYVQLMPDWHYLYGEPPGHYAHQQLYFAVKSRVNAAAHRVADEAGVEHRDLSLWLVKQHGFPWRRECRMQDLLRLLEFLCSPETVDAARSVAQYPNRSDN